MDRFTSNDIEIERKTPEACRRLTRHLKMQRIVGKGQQGTVRVYRNEVVKIVPLGRRSALSPNLSEATYEVACLQRLLGTRISAAFHGAWICDNAKGRMTMYIQMERIPKAVTLFHYLQTVGECFRMHDLKTLVQHVYTMNTVYGIINTDLDLHNIIVSHTRGAIDRIVIIDFGLAYQAVDERFHVRADMDMVFLWYAFTKLIYDRDTPRALALSPGRIAIPKADIDALFVSYLKRYPGNRGKTMASLRHRWTSDSRIRSLRKEKEAFGKIVAGARGLLFASIY